MQTISSSPAEAQSASVKLGCWTNVLVVFSHHKEIYQALLKHYQGIAVGGALPGRKRKEAIRKFQKDKRTRIFFGRIKAEKESITLTAASAVLFVEIRC